MPRNPHRRQLVTVLLALLFAAIALLCRIDTSSALPGLPVVVAPAPVLRQPASDITRDDQETINLLSDLADNLESVPTLKEGLALPQLGIAKRGFVVVIDDDAIVMINPELTLRGPLEASREGCLSLPGQYGWVNRYTQVTVSFRDEDWSRQRLDLAGFEAFLVQHENDHLDGILFTDKLIPEPPAKPRLD